MKIISSRLSIYASALFLAVAVAFTPLVAQPASAQLSSGLNAAKTSTTADNKGAKDIVTSVVNILLYIVAALSVIFLIFGGIKYATSAGDSSKVTSAKNTVMYAIVGVVVAAFAYAIVNWVLGSLNVTTAETKTDKTSETKKE